jgi:hypothetical protein
MFEIKSGLVMHGPDRPKQRAAMERVGGGVGGLWITILSLFVRFIRHCRRPSKNRNYTDWIN